MEEILRFLDTVVDLRQEKKVCHKIKDIVILVFFAMLSGADEWTAYEIFGIEHESFLRKYLELTNGIPSHDTIQRVFAIIPSESLQKLQILWNDMINSSEGEKIRKLLAIDGKTQRGNGNKNQKANHIISAVDEAGFCVGEKRVNEKSNEITAIPDLLDSLNIKGNIITIDAMGTQKEIAKKIRKKQADYVLALKGNQGSLYNDVKLYFKDKTLLSKCKYIKTTEKARGGIEKREYWQTDDISWLSQKKEWLGFRSIAMTRNTIQKDRKVTCETRYFITSLPVNIELTALAIRKHWMVESYHWYLDVTFREDSSRTPEKQAAYNQNILRKLALNVLKLFEIGKKRLSVRMKRFSVSINPEKHLENIIALL